VAVAAAVGVLAALVGCAGQSTQTPVEAAQAAVSAAQDALSAAESDATAAAAAFCSASSDYITALDRYGDVLNATAPTVGDVTDAGRDLTAPREETLSAAEDAVDARDAVAEAEQDLAAAQAGLAAAQASASDGTPTPAGPSPGPSATTTPAPATVARVEQAESELADARAGITGQTPLVQAAEQFNAAAVALEMAWLQLFADAGCLSEEQQAQAVSAVREYTAALQQSLADTGYYTGQVDGVYGPMTVDAVEALQAAHSLPQTGTVDKATAAALQAELDQLGEAASLESTATTAALQQTLKLAGYWDGPVDGVWTDALTQAVMTLQTDLGVPVTGTVDAATISAFQEAVAAARETSEPSPAPEPSSPTSPPVQSSPTGT
jgi:peptidoglycan hydrolase-like protein with peptidoglycan-binding domain